MSINLIPRKSHIRFEPTDDSRLDNKFLATDQRIVGKGLLIKKIYSINISEKSTHFKPPFRPIFTQQTVFAIITFKFNSF